MHDHPILIVRVLVKSKDELLDVGHGFGLRCAIDHLSRSDETKCRKDRNDGDYNQ
jgi:hypothetical protein